jgi:hypothetical protein
LGPSFHAKFTAQEGAGRPLSKGTGAPLSDLSSALVFPRNFDRISSPDSNSCSGCHNAPILGGGGDRVTETPVTDLKLEHYKIHRWFKVVLESRKSGCTGKISTPAAYKP